jgi:hypothetical protein
MGGLPAHVFLYHAAHIQLPFILCGQEVDARDELYQYQDYNQGKGILK